MYLIVEPIWILFSHLSYRYISSLFTQTAAPVSVERQIQTSERLEAETLCTREGQVEFIEVTIVEVRTSMLH